MSAKPTVLPLPLTLSGAAFGETRRRWLTPWCILLADIATLCTVYIVGTFLHHDPALDGSFQPYLDLLPILLMTLCGFWIQGLYPGALMHPAETMRRVAVTTTCVFFGVTGGSFLWRVGQGYSRLVFIMIWLISPPAVLLMRHLLQGTLSKYPWWGVPALILGSGPSAKRVIKTLQAKNRGVRVIGVLSDANAKEWPRNMPQILGSISQAPEFARLGVAQYIILTMPLEKNVELRHIIRDCCYGFSHVLLVPDLPGLCTLGASTRDLSGDIGLELPQRLFHRTASLAKRSIDLLISTFLLLLLLPALICISVAVRLTSPGPIFFLHKRYGKQERTFYALKFRTMVIDADSVLESHLAEHPDELTEWRRDQKLRNDPRITPVGRWLRRLSLDELPQLINVIVGQMSLVGPRPIVKAEIEKYGCEFNLYKRVLPGITGLWQVSGRNNTTYQERVAFDEFYVNNWSIWLDLYILTRTIGAVLRKEGAY